MRDALNRHVWIAHKLLDLENEVDMGTMQKKLAHAPHFKRKRPRMITGAVAFSFAVITQQA